MGETDVVGTRAARRTLPELIAMRASPSSAPYAANISRTTAWNRYPLLNGAACGR